MAQQSGHTPQSRNPQSGPTVKPMGKEVSRQTFISPGQPWNVILWFLIIAIVVILAIYGIYAG
jgi:hypothetical protein